MLGFQAFIPEKLKNIMFQTKASNLIEEIEKIKKFLSEAQSKQMTIIRDPLHSKSDHGENNDKEDESNDNNGVFWADVVIVDDDKSAIDINKNIIHMGDKPANETRKNSLKRRSWLQDNLDDNNFLSHSTVRVTNL